MGRIKYKKYQAVRESIPAFTLNQIGKVALNRAKAGERYQYLEIITSQLMCGLTLEAVLNYIGKKLSDNWEERERKLSIEKKIKEIAKGIGLDKQLDSYPFQLRHEISDFRNKIVHAKSSKHVAKEIRQDQIDEDGFPIVPSVSELMTDWEKSVVHPLNWTHGQNKLNCVQEGVRNGTDKKEF